MEHDEAIEQDLASRYLSGGLAPEQREAFEEHFIDCPRCLDALESADGLQRGLRSIAAQDAPNAGIQSAERSRRWRGAIVPAAGIAAAVAIAVGGADLVRTRRELARVSRVATDRAEQSERAQSLVNSLSHRLDQLENAPRAVAAGQSSAPVFALTTVRGGATSTPPNSVRLSDAPDWIVLSLELDDPNASGSFRAAVRDGQGRERWRDDHLTASPPGTLGIALRAALLDDGDYTLEVDRQPPGSTAWTPAGRYAFRVRRSR
jgi:Putative zinc-finger